MAAAPRADSFSRSGDQMRVPDNVTKCIVFLSYHDKVKDKYVPVGTAFYLGRDNGETCDRVYLVTAKHVIMGLLNYGVMSVYAIVNQKDEQPEAKKYVEIPTKSWFFHSTDKSIDIAIFEIGIPPEADQMAFPISLGINDKIMSENEVGLGDSVFITGLFSHHHGTTRNIPIVRTGNLAAFDEEKVTTKDFGAIDAYLIEARSIGGLSGSPVVLNLGYVRSFGGAVKFRKSSNPAFYLMGAIHGHYDSNLGGIDGFPSVENSAPSNEIINTGIAIVVPFYKILEVIEEYENSPPT